MGKTREELLEILSKSHRERLERLSSREKLLEAIREEGLLNELVTVSETEDGLEARDLAAQDMVLRLTHREDGSTELAWAEAGRPFSEREVYAAPAEAYSAFFAFLECSRNLSEMKKAKAPRQDAGFRGLLARFFGRK